MSFLLDGFWIGLLLAIPVGPTAILCIRNALIYGMTLGFYTGLGAALADALYGLIASFGVLWLKELFVSHHLLFHILGGLLLCILGIKTFWSNISISGKGLFEFAPSKKELVLTTFLLTATSPLTILAFIGVFATFGIDIPKKDPGSALVLSLGVLLGSALWWIVLSFFSSLFRKKMRSHSLSWLNRISGVLLFLIGLFVLLSFKKNLL